MFLPASIAAFSASFSNSFCFLLFASCSSLKRSFFFLPASIAAFSAPFSNSFCFLLFASCSFLRRTFVFLPASIAAFSASSSNLFLSFFIFLRVKWFLYIFWIFFADIFSLNFCFFCLSCDLLYKLFAFCSSLRRSFVFLPASIAAFSASFSNSFCFLLFASCSSLKRSFFFLPASIAAFSAPFSNSFCFLLFASCSFLRRTFVFLPASIAAFSASSSNLFLSFFIFLRVKWFLYIFWIFFADIFSLNFCFFNSLFSYSLLAFEPILLIFIL